MMRHGSLLLVAAGAAVVLGSCGGDDASTSTTGAAASTTSGAGGAGTGAGGAGAGDTGTGASGGAGGASTAGVGGAGGAGGGLPAADGGRCTSDAGCLGGMCMTEQATGHPGGYCSAACDPASPACPGGGVCVPDSAGGGRCRAACGASGCRDGYECLPVSASESACFPRCDDDAQCPATGACNAERRLCSAPEMCGDLQDNDEDSWIDCVDQDCYAACAPQVAAACAQATPAGASASGDTSGGADVLGPHCAKSPGGGQQVFTVNPPGPGVVHLTVTSATEHSVAVRLACDDPGSFQGCEGGPGPATLDVDVQDSAPIYAIVSAAEPGQEGPFTLDVDFEAQVCGDGQVVGAETCDDGDTLGGDGCSASCQVEPAYYCALTLPLLLGNNVGTTSTGSDALDASCSIGAKEQIYTYTAPTSGTLTLTLTAEADMTLSARTSCTSYSSQIECIDYDYQDGVETMNLPLAAGAEVTVLVQGYSAAHEGPYMLTAAFGP